MPSATTAPATVGEALDEAVCALDRAGAEPARLTAEMLLAHVLGVERVALQARPERLLAESSVERLGALARRRAAGEPVQYLVGRQEFFGRDFEVSPAVLIPRPETEVLVEAALQRIRPGARVLDLATGSGAIAATLKLERPTLAVTGSDRSRAALAVAHGNAVRNGAAVRFVCSDWLGAFRPDAVDAIVSNPPYVAESARGGLQREVLAEPEQALFAGADGLDAYRTLIPQAAQVLAEGGLLLLELGYDSLQGVRDLLAGGAWGEPETVDDLAGVARVLVVRRA